MATEANSFAIGHLKSVISARVPVLPYTNSVMPWIERHLEGLVVFGRAGGTAVDHDLETAPSELNAEAGFVGHPERCWHGH
jgi:hypothetical protein